MLTVPRPARARVAQMRDTGTDAGITLTELLVTMVLMSIVSALALTWLLGSSNSNTKTTNSGFATSDARNVLQSWPALLRVADSPYNAPAALAASGSPTPAATTGAPGDSTGRFLAISPTSLTFNADVGNRAPCSTACARTDTTQVTLALTNGALTQKLVTSSGTNAITFVRTGATTGACLFTAYDVDGNSLGCDPSTTPLASIARIDLTFSVTPDNSGTKQTFSTSTAITGTFAPIVSTATAASP